MKRFIYQTTDIIEGKPVNTYFGHKGDFFVEIAQEWREDGFYMAAKYGYKTRRGAENNKIYKENKDRFGIEIIEVEA